MIFKLFFKRKIDPSITEEPKVASPTLESIFATAHANIGRDLRNPRIIQPKTITAHQRPAKMALLQPEEAKEKNEWFVRRTNENTTCLSYICNNPNMPISIEVGVDEDLFFYLICQTDKHVKESDQLFNIDIDATAKAEIITELSTQQVRGLKLLFLHKWDEGSYELIDYPNNCGFKLSHISIEQVDSLMEALPEASVLINLMKQESKRIASSFDVFAVQQYQEEAAKRLTSEKRL